MLDLLQININNLASIKSDTYFFKKGLEIILGINKDTLPIELRNLSLDKLLEIKNINLSSNGSGKSMIIEALNICLFGTPIRPRVNLRELITQGEEECTIELICKNKWLELSKIRIIRTFFRNKNKTSITRIFEQKNGEEEIEIQKGPNDFDKYILDKYISLSKEDLINFFIIQKERYVPFLILSDTKKKDILSRFTGIQKYFYVQDKIDSKIDEISNNNIKLLNEISRKNGQKDILLEQKESLLDEENFKSKINSDNKILNDKILDKKKNINNFDNNEKDISIKQNNIIKLIDYWNSKKRIFDKFIVKNKYLTKKEELNLKIKDKDKEIEEIKDSIDEAEEELGTNKLEYSKLESTYNKLKSILSNLIICPKCGFEFDATNGKDKNELNSSLNINESLKNKKNNKVLEIKKDIKELSEIKNNLEKEREDIKQNIFSNNKNLRKIDNIGNRIKDFIKEYKQDIIFNSKKIQEFKEQKINIENSIKILEQEIEDNNNKSYDLEVINKKKEINNKINILDKNIKDNNKIIENNNKEIQLNKDASITFNTFKNYLYNKMIFTIECLVNSYLQDFGILSVQIKGSKVLSDGKTNRDEINCIVNKNNKEYNYFALSSGEKSQIDIAFIATFQKILNITSKNGLNFLVLDEVTGVIDSYNQDKILRPLDKLNQPIIFISHININSEFNTSYIIKNNDISKIIKI